MTVLLTARGVTKAYGGRPVLRGVALEIRAGVSMGLVGPSGAGKTTLGRLLLALERPDRGVIRWGDSPPRRELRPAYQALFQNGPASLPPGQSVLAAVLEPARRHRRLSRRGALEAAAPLLVRLGLSSARLGGPRETLSAGEAGRAALARALLLRPRFLLLDEPFQALDAWHRLRLVEVLREGQQRDGLTLLVISHDPRPLPYLVRRGLVLAAGRVLETGPWARLRRRPRHPLTRRLLAPLVPGVPLV